LTSELERGEWSVSSTGRFTPRERVPGTRWIGGWVGPRAGLDAVVSRLFAQLPKQTQTTNNRIFRPTSCILKIFTVTVLSRPLHGSVSIIIIIIILACYGWKCIFWNLCIYWTVGRTPCTGDRPDARPLPMHRTTQHRKTRAHIHASSGIRTHDPSVPAVINSTLGHWDLRKC